jgi:sugar/nucleoside kinase (ribokinase family)
VRVTAVGDCGVDRYLDLGRDLGFFGLSASDGDLIDALETRARRQRQVFVVTLGGQGSLAVGGAQRLSCPAAEVAQVVDTTGAGDTLAAGFLREYCASRDAARSLARGAEEAAASVQRVGAFPWED